MTTTIHMDHLTDVTYEQPVFVKFLITGYNSPVEFDELSYAMDTCSFPSVSPVNQFTVVLTVKADSSVEVFGPFLTDKQANAWAEASLHTPWQVQTVNNVTFRSAR